MFIEVKIQNLSIDPNTNSPLVVLGDLKGKNSFPIWIGAYEASAIAMEIEQVAIDRPMTHDLLKRILEDLGGTLVRVEVTDLVESTFHARLVVKVPSGERIYIDARPSDAIALALRCQAPIFAEEILFRAEPESMLVGDYIPTARDGEDWEEVLKNLSDEAFGKYRM